MIEVQQAGERQLVEFSEFARLARSGWIQPDALISGELLTAGQRVRARQLRTYALARGLPVPPTQLGPVKTTTPDVSRVLSHFRWQGGMWIEMAPRLNQLLSPAGWEPEASAERPGRRDRTGQAAIFFLCAAAGYLLAGWLAALLP